MQKTMNKRMGVNKTFIDWGTVESDTENDNETPIETETKLLPRTRPKMLVPQKSSNKPLQKWIKENKNSYNVTRNDIKYIYRNLIFTKTFGELKEIMDNEIVRDSYPALVIVVIAGVLGDIARGNILNITRMLQFIFPEPTKGIDFDNLKCAGSSGYNELLALEETLRRLEGDDSILIIDKLLIEGTKE
jgi:hypothetical protein